MRRILLPGMLVMNFLTQGIGQQVIGSFPQMDGGFETQLNIPLTSTTIPNGVPRIDWTVQNNSGTAMVYATGGRSGPKYLAFSATATRKLQSPTAANMAVQNATPYTIQFFYRSSAVASNGQVGVSTDGTGSQGTYVPVLLPSTNGIWTKVTQSASGGTSTANPRYGIGIIRLSSASGTAIDLDDFVMYPGPVDNVPPAQPGTPTFATVTDSTITVSWAAAIGGIDGGGYLVVRYLSSPLPSDGPNQNGIYPAGSPVSQSSSGEIRYIGTALTFTDVGLSPGVTYYYCIYTVDKAFNYSSPAQADCSTTGAVVPVLQASSLAFSGVTGTSLQVNWFNGSGSKRIVVINTSASFTAPINGTDPPALTQYGGSGEQVVYNGPGDSTQAEGLQPATNYWFRVYEYNGTGVNTVYNTGVATGNPAAQQTIVGSPVPVVSLSGIDWIASDSARIGGTVFSIGGSPLTGRGTVWGIAPGVTASDNPLSEGGNSLGSFRHTRNLPPQSHIYFKAYAINSTGTGLSPESDFFTLAREPASNVSGFSATGTGINEILLHWQNTVADGNGYLILCKPGTWAPDATPQDAIGYSTGSILGDAGVVAVINDIQTLTCTISGLIPATDYSFTIFPFAWDGQQAATLNYRTSLPFSAAFASTLIPLPTVYQWIGQEMSDWNIPSNWNPPRTQPVINDILKFQQGGVRSVLNVPSQRIGQVIVSDSTQITLFANTAVTLSVRGEAGADFRIDPGSSFDLAGDNPIVIAMESGATAAVDGNLSFDGQTTGTYHKLTGSDPLAITFSTGSVFTSGIRMAGNPFGNSKAGSVVFENGSVYRARGGGNPFAMSQPASVVVFQPGSCYKHMSTGIPSVSGRTYADFELDNGCNGSLINASGAAQLTVGNLILTTGDISFNLTDGMVITGDIVVGNGTKLVFSPSSAASVTLSGAGVRKITGSGILEIKPAVSLKVRRAVRLERDLQCEGAMTIDGGGFLKVAPGRGLEINGTITLLQDLGLLLESDSTGTASLIDHGIVQGENRVSMQRFLTGYETPDDRRYHFLSSPMQAQPICPGFVNLPNPTDDFYFWDETSGTWINSRSSGGNWRTGFDSLFVPGKGYLAAYPVDKTTEFTGRLNSFPAGSPLEMECSYSAGPAGGEGWNLLGNPFPSLLDWSLAGRGDGVDAALYYYDAGLQNYRYFLQAAPGVFLGNGSRYVPAMQGFMVHANSTGISREVQFDNSMRTMNADTLYYKSNTAVPVLSLVLQCNGKKDQAFVSFDQANRTGFESCCDAYKLDPGIADMPMISTGSTGGEQLSINSMPWRFPGNRIPVRIKHPEGVSCRLLVSGLETLEAGTSVRLEEESGTLLANLMQESDYIFSEVAPTEILVFLSFAGGKFSDSLETAETSIRGEAGEIVFVCADPDAKRVAEVFNLLGQRLMSVTLPVETETRISTLGHTGVLLVRLYSKNEIATEKVVVR